MVTQLFTITYDIYIIIVGVKPHTTHVYVSGSVCIRESRCLLCVGDAVLLHWPGIRVLCGRITGRVLSVWKEIVNLKAKELCVHISSEQINAAVGSEESVHRGYVCRKCFSAYEKFANIRETLIAKVVIPSLALPEEETDTNIII